MNRYIDSDLAWLAVDAVGHIAVFTTAGAAPIPSAVLDHPELIKSAEELLTQLRPIGRSQLLVTLPRPDDFVGFACRGFFAYDWRDVHRTGSYTNCYEIIARPEVARAVSDLACELQALATMVRFDTLSFHDAVNIRVDQLVACESA